MKKIPLLFATVSLVGVAHAAVVPGDAFTFDIAGFNSTTLVGYVLGSDFTSTFGTTQTFTGAGYNGQDITIASSESVGATMTTDTFTVSTPTNFLTSSSVNGTSITALQFDLGDANSGSNTVDLSSPIASATSTGHILYGSANTSFTLTSAPVLSNGGLSYADVEGVNTGTTAISGIAIHQFTMSVTYANPVPTPEPSAFAALGLGAVAVLRRRKRA